MTEFTLPFSIFRSYVSYFSTMDSCFSTTGVKMSRRLLDHLGLYFQKRSFKRFGREPNRLHSSVNRRVVRDAWPVLGITQDARDNDVKRPGYSSWEASGPPYFMESPATLTFCSPIVIQLLYNFDIVFCILVTGVHTKVCLAVQCAVRMLAFWTVGFQAPAQFYRLRKTTSCAKVNGSTKEAAWTCAVL
jgi:hypothetical protein